MLKKSILLLFTIFFIYSCSNDQPKSGKVMQIVKLRTSLNDEEFLKKSHEREPKFTANPAIIQKYYIKLDEPGYYGGVYIWESAEALEKFKKSELAVSIPKAYKGIEKPSIEIVNIFFN